MLRAIFACAAASFAATLGDALVEGCSNSGLFGHARYSDGSSLNLLPMTLTALFALSIALAVLAHAHLRRTSLPHRKSVPTTPYDLSIGVACALLPCIVVIEFLLLYGMESAEQFIVYGHSLGGTIWLGGPVVVSVAVHVALTVASTFGLRNVLHSLTATVLSVLAVCITMLRRLCDGESAQRVRRALVAVAPMYLFVAQLRERGPPALR